MPSSALTSLLLDLRQHPAFKEFLAENPVPPLPRFKRSQAVEVERARAEWIYQSGKRDQHDVWIAFLTGQVPEREETSSSQKE